MIRQALIALLLGVAGLRAGAAQGPARPPVGDVGAIEGAVFDSIALRPMAEALVQLVRVGANGAPAEARSTRTDSAGLYGFPDVPFGTYLLGFQHLTIDTLGFRAPVHRVDVRRGGTVRVALAVPSMASIVTRVCGASSARDSASLLVGSVRDAVTDGAIHDAYVSLKWAELVLTRAGLAREMPTHDLRTDGDGWYTACVPSGVPVTAHAERDTLRSGDVLVTLSTLGILRRDLYIGAANRVIMGADDSVRTSGAVLEGDRLVATGFGTVSGVVRSLDGTPLARARVALVGGSGETRTDERGRFVLRGLPHGTHSVEARLIGYIPDEATVDVVAFREVTTVIALADLRATMLDTVRVRSIRLAEERAKAGFDRRRRSGVGVFIDETAIDTLKVHTFSDLLRGIPGIQFTEGRAQNEAFERQVQWARGRGMPCPPQIFVDGVKLIRGITDLDQFLSVRSVRRVEAYARGSNLPAEFASSEALCGVIGIWTGAPPLRAKPDTAAGRGSR